jgi:hypothetical protein
MLYINIAGFILPPIALAVFLRWLRRDRLRFIEQMRADGYDPEKVSIATIAHFQAEETRRRSLIGWIRMRHLQRMRRDAQR